MKMKSTIGKLFWTRNPKADMFFSITLAYVLIFAIAPIVAYIAFAAPLNSITWPVRMLLNADEQAGWLARCALILVVLYMKLLEVGYFLHLLRAAYAMKNALPSHWRRSHA